MRRRMDAEITNQITPEISTPTNPITSRDPLSAVIRLLGIVQATSEGGVVPGILALLRTCSVILRNHEIMNS